MGLNLYSAWSDWAFYLTAAVFALALFLLVFSIRKYLEIANGSVFEEEDGVAGQAPGTPAEAAAEPGTAAGTEAETEPDPVVAAPGSRAEEFVKGLYEQLMRLDARVRNIEADLSGNVNHEYTAKFLEDIISDFDLMDKPKIKSRIKYLLTDLRK